MSFIITRSDLLAPKKEQVDSLMPYIVEVLRDALGGTGENVRLGNVRCVSAKRGMVDEAGQRRHLESGRRRMDGGKSKCGQK